MVKSEFSVIQSSSHPLIITVFTVGSTEYCSDIAEWAGFYFFVVNEEQPSCGYIPYLMQEQCISNRESIVSISSVDDVAGVGAGVTIRVHTGPSPRHVASDVFTSRE